MCTFPNLLFTVLDDLCRKYDNCDDVVFKWFLLDEVPASNPDVSRGFPLCPHADDRIKSGHSPQLHPFDFLKIILFKFSTV
jgi:hypothetical protein